MTGDYRLLIRRVGGPDVIEREAIDVGDPGPHEVLIRQDAIGVNFIDTYQRSGLYPIDLPSGLGSEAAGVIEKIGSGVSGWRPGDRVAYATSRSPGAYATRRLLAAETLVRLPDAIDARTAAAVLLKGMTVDMLVGACGRLTPSDVVLVHAAAGGVGSLLVQWAKAIGATVIAHAGTADKATHALRLCADHSLSCSLDDLAPAVRALTDGKGCTVVFDGIGTASWAASLAATARRGLVVSYGNASGPVPPVAPLELGKAGSLFLTRPTLFDYVDTPARLQASADRLFGLIAAGKLMVEIGRILPLADAATAHRAIEARETRGSTILLP